MAFKPSFVILFLMNEKDFFYLLSLLHFYFVALWYFILFIYLRLICIRYLYKCWQFVLFINFPMNGFEWFVNVEASLTNFVAEGMYCPLHDIGSDPFRGPSHHLIVYTSLHRNDSSM